MANVAIVAFLGLLAGALGFCVILAYAIGDNGEVPGTGTMMAVYALTTALGLWWSAPVYRMLEHERLG